MNVAPKPSADVVTFPAGGPAATKGAVGRADAAADAAAEVERLRTLLDKQPSCLIRVGTDGTLLAVSDAGLGVLGAQQLTQVLGTNLVDRLQGASASLWADFAHRVSTGGSGSVECELLDLSGVSRAVVLLGLALANHPDGLGSLLVTVRDVSAARRLETSLQEEEGRRRSIQTALDDATVTLQELRARLDEAEVEKRQLHMMLEAAAGQRQQFASSVATSLREEQERRRALQAALDEATASTQQFHAQTAHLAAENSELRTALEGATAERHHMAVSFERVTEALTAAMDAAALAQQVLERERTP